jgi:apolipoprotein D and lipocalin family protein
MRLFKPLIFSAALVTLNACMVAGPVGNASVPRPARSVDVSRYSGMWYELARYENGFQRGCEAVTAQYTAKPNGEVRVLNTCRDGSPRGPARTAEGSARAVPGSGNAKFKVSFFGPFYVGNYWVLDRAQDYSWAIVGEPSGRYLWLLSRTKSRSMLSKLMGRADRLGYDTSILRTTRH